MLRKGRHFVNLASPPLAFFADGGCGVEVEVEGGAVFASGLPLGHGQLAGFILFDTFHLPPDNGQGELADGAVIRAGDSAQAFVEVVGNVYFKACHSVTPRCQVSLPGYSCIAL